MNRFVDLHNLEIEIKDIVGGFSGTKIIDEACVNVTDVNSKIQILKDKVKELKK